MKPIIFSVHAELRRKQRGITKKVVRECIEFPTTQDVQIDGCVNIQAKKEVICREEKNYIKVISVIK